MTLHTRVRITAPLGSTDLALLWEHALADVVAGSSPDAPHAWTEAPDGLSRHTVPGQGLCGILEASVGADRGELVRGDDPEYDYVDTDPHAWAEVGWDTGYSYDDEHGGCGTLHARLIVALGAWLDARALPWSWYNEFAGTWHEGATDLAALLDGGVAATSWFASIQPLLAARGVRPV